MIKFANEQKACQQLATAFQKGDEADIKAAFESFHASVAQQVIEDFKEAQASADKGILAERGYRQLTSREEKWYQKVITALKAPDWKQSFATIIGSPEEDDLMPETIIEDVYRHLEEEHPLLSKVNFQYVGYSTKWIRTDKTVDAAVWGKITDAISKEITEAFEVIDVTHNKLSAYAVIELSMLDLGPVFLDGYIRRCLMEALALGWENGIVNGDGKQAPIGMTRDIHEGVSVSGGSYPEKTDGQGLVEVTSFDIPEYMGLVAKLAKTEKGRNRKLNKVALICNQADYLTKVAPATTILLPEGKYANDLFPFPTEVIISNAVASGKAVLGLLDEYDALAGGKRGQTIETSDEFKFLDDTRYFKIKQHGTGRAFDNTSFLLLDISELKPTYLKVQVEGTVTTNAAAAAASARAKASK